MALAVVLVAILASPAAASEPARAELQVRPVAVADGGAIDDETGDRLILKQAILERSLEEGARDRALEKMVGKGRCRQLDRALFMFDLHAPYLGRDPRDDPRFEDARDAVFSAWKKIQRERVEDALGIEAWWDRKRARMKRTLHDDDGESGSAEERGWSLRVSPRFSDDAVGVKLGLRGTGTLLDYMTFRYTYEMDDSYPVFTIKFEDRLRFLDLNYAPDTPEFGDRIGLGLRYSW